jgi:peptidoglycan/LPS O-acetylase OafA/YrhL
MHLVEQDEAKAVADQNGIPALDGWRAIAILMVLLANCDRIDIGATVTNPGLLLSRLLVKEQLKFTGLISYCIYLWQQVFLRPT